jgi:hypothetical protein
LFKYDYAMRWKYVREDREGDRDKREGDELKEDE